MYSDSILSDGSLNTKVTKNINLLIVNNALFINHEFRNCMNPHHGSQLALTNLARGLNQDSRRKQSSKARQSIATEVVNSHTNRY
jgi:hypothetical protein